jgi:hypothetical protein
VLKIWACRGRAEDLGMSGTCRRFGSVGDWLKSRGPVGDWPKIWVSRGLAEDLGQSGTGRRFGSVGDWLKSRGIRHFILYELRCECDDDVQVLFYLHIMSCLLCC